MAREPVSKKLRFEVFKRDGFTCQYCGLKAPEVVLNCDHIKPVAAGGTTDILNLITACFSCNSGKGARELTDATVVTKQLDHLAELNDRREQIEMMLAWRDELQSLASDTVEMIVTRIAQRTGWGVNESGRNKIKNWLKKHSFAEVVRGVDESFDTYLRIVNDKPTDESWEKAFSKIPGVVQVLKQEATRPHLRRLLYIQGIVRKRSKARRYDCIDYLEHLVNCGIDIDALEMRAKRLTSLEDFEGPYDAWLNEIGKSF
jgi:hypothetical protein